LRIEMTESGAGREPAHNEDDEISLMAVGSLLLRWRRMIIALSLIGAVLGLAAGLLSTRVYISAATFIPQGSENGATSGLALAASQFGIRVPTAGGGWGPPIYVELMHSRTLLEPIALDTVVVTERGGQRAALMDLLEVKAPTAAQRTGRAVSALRNLVTATEDKKLGAVKVTVTTRWPSVSLMLVERLVRGVNQFNLETRKSQATAERQFVEARAGEAERALREMEDRLQAFLQRNRAISSSPELGFERDRLQREVALRQQVYTTLVQNQEEARIREVRDTPVITVLEDPRLPVISESRGTMKKIILGALVGGFIGMAIAFIANAMIAARRDSSEEAQEFFQLVKEITPRFLRRGTR
jgi:uncharacterized protein involved in exopolysaccharide biosynthesis